MTFQDRDRDEQLPIPPTGLLAGMQPAFQHARTGESHLAQLEEGIPALVYGFAGLPEEWIVERDNAGNAIALHPDVIAGYWRDARFIALSQLSCMPLDD
ncbi:MAG: hypothetical protein AB8B64_21465 [Granulosicoccus sp.]